MRGKRRDGVLLASGEEKIQRGLLGRWWLLCLGEDLLCRRLKSQACLAAEEEEKSEGEGGGRRLGFGEGEEPNFLFFWVFSFFCVFGSLPKITK